RRHGRERLADAAACRHPGRAGGAAALDREHDPRRCRARGAGGRDLSLARRDRGAVGARPRLRAAACRRRAGGALRGLAGRGAPDAQRQGMSRPRSVLAIRAGLGESPVWDRSARALSWTDGRKPSINCFDPATGETRAVATPEPVHAIALTRSRRLICAFEASLGLFDPATGALERLATLIEGVEDNLNDGAVDRAG